MGAIANFLRGRNRATLKEREYEEDEKIRDRVELRKKSHAERVIIQTLEEQRQKELKEAMRLEERKRQMTEKLIGRNMMVSNINLLK